MEPHYVAFDPGLHTGWAIWDVEGNFLDMGTTHTYEDLHEKLASLPASIKIVIIEDFTLWSRKAKQQAGSKMPAPKAIGQIETFARIWGAQIVKQDSAIKPIAEKWTGQFTKNPRTGKPIPKIQTHVLDAFNHGEYYLIINKIKEIDLRL